MSRRSLVVGLAALALGLAGCGLGAGRSASGVRLTVSDDFGRHTLVDSAHPRAGGADTVMRLLERNARVTTAYGGGFVESIDGLSGGQAGGRPIDWFYYVNGTEASQGAAATALHSGDVVWWDRHDWSATMHIPAVIGSFPEPFLHGTGTGRRLPVSIQCGEAGSRACALVADALVRVGVVAGTGVVGESPGSDSVSVLVGPWSTLDAITDLLPLERGPRDSGVYARMAGNGRTITLLDPNGRAVRTLGAGSGLVAASQNGAGQPYWVVTGTDRAGTLSAARAFADGQSALGGRFALAVSHDQGISLPVEGP